MRREDKSVARCDTFVETTTETSSAFALREISRQRVNPQASHSRCVLLVGTFVSRVHAGSGAQKTPKSSSPPGLFGRNLKGVALIQVESSRTDISHRYQRKVGPTARRAILSHKHLDPDTANTSQATIFLVCPDAYTHAEARVCLCGVHARAVFRAEISRLACPGAASWHQRDVKPLDTPPRASAA